MIEEEETNAQRYGTHIYAFTILASIIPAIARNEEGKE
jgi:hypothetical protein